MNDVKTFAVLHGDRKIVTKEDAEAAGLGDGALVKLCVLWADNDFEEPERHEAWYPIGMVYWGRVANLVGTDARMSGSNGWLDDRGGFWPSEHGKDTKPVLYETFPLQRPRVRCEVRYRNGRWEKLLKSKGWVTA